MYTYVYTCAHLLLIYTHTSDDMNTHLSFSSHAHAPLSIRMGINEGGGVYETLSIQGRHTVYNICDPLSKCVLRRAPVRAWCLRVYACARV